MLFGFVSTFFISMRIAEMANPAKRDYRREADLLMP